MARSSKARLQDRILLYINRNEVSTLSQLARDLDAVRSSVSRATHALVKLGLVKQENTVWCLTNEGSKEVERLQAMLPKRTTSIAQVIERMKNQHQQVLRAADGIGTLRQAIDQFPKFTPAIATMRSELIDQTQKARQSLADMMGTSPLADAFARSGLRASIDGLERQMAGNAAYALGQIMNETSADALRHRIDAEQVGQRIAALTNTAGLAAMRSGLFDEGQKARQSLADMMGTSPLADAFAQSGQQAARDALSSQAAYITASARLDSGLAPGEAMRRSAIALASQAPYVQAVSATRAAAALFGESQQRNLMALGLASKIDTLGLRPSRELAAANLGVSKIISDLGTIQARLQTDHATAIGAARLFPRVAEIGQMYNGYVQDVARELDVDRQFLEQPGRLVIPTSTTAKFVEAVRDATNVDEVEEQPSDYQQAWNAQALQFEEVFGSVGPNIRTMWQGAIQVLHSSNPDRLRQAAHSGREVLMQTLALLAPDSCFTDDELQQAGELSKISRKMRIKKILTGNSKSSADWAESMAKGCEELYGRLAGVSHNRDLYPQITEAQVIGYLHSMAGTLLFIISSRRQD